MSEDEIIITYEQTDLTELYNKLDSIQEQLDETNEKLDTLHEDNVLSYNSFYGDDFPTDLSDDYISVYSTFGTVSDSLEEMKSELEYNRYNTTWLSLLLSLVIGLLFVLIFKRK